MYGILRGTRDWMEIELESERAGFVAKIKASAELQALFEEMGFIWSHRRSDVREMRMVVEEYEAGRLT